MPKTVYVIPARAGSKGLPFKNRKLLPFTLSALKGMKTIYITTDDEEIKNKYKDICHIIDRPEALGSDNASMKDVLTHVKHDLKLSDDTLMVCLYLTYPERQTSDIKDAIAFFKKTGAKSMLCRKEYRGVSPYLMAHPAGSFQGVPIIKHNLYRRQDYLPVFEISHFIVIIKAGELRYVNDNLYNENTIFMPVGKDVIDIDTPSDFDRFENK